MRRKASDVAARPCEERWLIDRCEITEPVRARAEMFRGSVTVIGKALREFFGEDVDIFRVTVMEQVPDDINAVFAAGFDERIDGAEIVLAAPIDERPAHRLAGGGNADFVKPLVIFLDMFVVVRSANLIDPFAAGVVASGAFKSCEEKATKHVESFLPGRRLIGRRVRNPRRRGRGTSLPILFQFD